MADQEKSSKRIENLLKDMMIIQLAIAGVGQMEIREIVGGDIVRVNRIVKRVRKSLAKTRSERD